LDKMSAFANGLSQRDDVTLMVIGVRDVTDPQLIKTWAVSRSPAVRGG
jgi:hypothetical protein